MQYRAGPGRLFFFFAVSCVVIVALQGCVILDWLKDPTNRDRAANTAETVGHGLETAAGVVAGTPAAPLSVPLLILAKVAGAAAMCLRPKKQKGVSETVPEQGEIVKKMGLLDSRKTKLQALAYVVYGIVTFAVIQWDLPKEVAALVIAGCAWVTGKNIDGIATEDAAKKANGN